MRYQKGHSAWNKGKKGLTNSGSFQKGHKPIITDTSLIRERCICGAFISKDKSKPHICKNVDLRGDRYCMDCGSLLRNDKLHERYSKICSKCSKKLQRQKERDLRAKLIKQFGGKCEICGYSKYTECLEFHHKNNTDKKGKHFLKEILKQPDCFNLWCNRCHREKEIDLKKGSEVNNG